MIVLIKKVEADMYDYMGNKRIAFRCIKESDTEMVLAWRNSDHVRKYFLYKAIITPEDHMNWLKSKVDTGKVVQFVVYDVENGDIPFASVYLRDIDKEHATAEYGVFIGNPEYIGKGYGQEIASLMVKYGFEVLNLNTISLRAYTDNVNAIHCYQKVGFKIKGNENNLISSDGREVCFMEINE